MCGVGERDNYVDKRRPTQITDWKQQLLARAADVFGGAQSPAHPPDLKTLHAKIGQLALEHDC